MTRSLLVFLLLLGGALPLSAQTKHTISGYIREEGSRELLIGASVYRAGTGVGTASNNYGFYSLTLPAADSVELVFSYVGYRPEVRRIRLNQDVVLNVGLKPNTRLQEVNIVASEQRERASEAVQMSSIEIPVTQIKTIPALLGEKDVIKVLQLMPGVQKGSEGSSGLYVRGGGPDQNLIILDDATVYNASHLFGFFSLFNGDAIKSVEMTKGGFPARYGGRLSSVIELSMKDGNKEELHGEGGVGLIASRLTLEGPLKKGVSSFLVSGRRTYADVLMRPFMPEDVKVGYYFYDLNAKVNYDFGRNNKLYLSGYFGQDRFSQSEELEDGGTDIGIHWGNATGTLRWNHLFNDRLFANASLVYSQYRFNITMEESNRDGGGYALDYLSGIRDIGIKYDFDFLPNPQHSIRMGVLSTYHRFKPRALAVRATEIGKQTNEVENIDVLESGVYIEDTYEPFPKLRLNAGVRLSHFSVKGKSYFRPEPRLGIGYRLLDDLSLKASYATMNQYVHLLSNTGVGLPTDLWVPTTERIAPQRSQQVALGLAKDFLEQDLALTVEGYYKKLDNIIGYKEGASFLLLEDAASAQEVSWENNITAGRGWSYGAEFLLQRKVGRFSGWLGYTLSWTQLQFDSLNFGRKYYARYDRRHDVSVVGIYQLSDRITLSGTWVYGTGNAITMPQSTYTAPTHEPGSRLDGGYQATDFGSMNSFRMAPYHRFDAGIQLIKKKRWGERTWEVSVYNLYSRRNPYFYYLSEEYRPNDNSSTTKVMQTSLFPIIPSVSYGFKF